jgi:hypothetical protein
LFVESMDGQRVDHLSGVVGDEPAVLLLIQFESDTGTAAVLVPVAAGSDDWPVGGNMDMFEITDRRFAACIVANADRGTCDGLPLAGRSGVVRRRELPAVPRSALKPYDALDRRDGRVGLLLSATMPMDKRAIGKGVSSPARIARDACIARTWTE